MEGNYPKQEGKKLPLVTHGNDLDGLVSAMIWYELKRMSGNRELVNNIFVFSYGSDRDEKWKELLEKWVTPTGRAIENNEEIWFTDISLRPGELDWVRPLNQRSRWIWVDHHISSDGFDTTDIFHEVYLKTDGSVCAADLMYELFKKAQIHNPNIKPWVELAHDRDLWIRKDPELALKLDLVVKANTHPEKFRDMVVTALTCTPEQYIAGVGQELVEEQMGYYRSSVELAQSTANRSTVAGKPVITCYTTGYESDVCEELYDTGEEIVVMIHPVRGTLIVGLRTKRTDVNLADMAKVVFNGGGHKQASGGRLDEKQIRGGYIAIVRTIKAYLEDEYGKVQGNGKALGNRKGTKATSGKGQK